MAKKILIVDDEADIRTFLKAFLEDNGYQTDIAEDGDVALKKAKQFQPDLVTLDIIMPNQTGVKFYREIRKDKDLSGVPVIILSGVTRYKELFARDHATMPRPYAFIEKPLDREELLKKIKEAIG